jgi:hypothetical protein
MSFFAEESVDIKGLRRLYNSNGCARALLDYMATRKYNSMETTVDRLESVVGDEWGRRDLVGVLKELQSLNCGEFIIGRRGQASRFQWAVQMISVGRTAKGDITGVELLKAEEAKPEESGETELPADAIRHVFNLRQNYLVTLELPTDLNSREANRLAEFIRTLPFDDAVDGS